jgi:hypothetical protein
VHVSADFDRDPRSTNDQSTIQSVEVEPENETAINSGKRQDEGAAGGDEPDLVPAPERTDGGDHLSPLSIGLRHDQVQHPRADVPAIEHDEQGQHEAESANQSSTNRDLRFRGIPPARGGSMR